MKICITAQGNGPEAQVDPRFGRCAYFIITDTEGSAFEAVQNPNTRGTGGVGVQSGQFLSERGVEAVLTGNVGPNAFRTLQSAGINIYTGVSGTVKEALERYRKGDMKPDDEAGAGPKAGMS